MLPRLWAIYLHGWRNNGGRGNSRSRSPLTAQFATIHPYFDGNGRTARLLTTLLLHRAGYGLKGIYSLEKYYTRDLEAYHAALTVGPSHNYYMGRVARRPVRMGRVFLSRCGRCLRQCARPRGGGGENRGQEPGNTTAQTGCPTASSRGLVRDRTLRHHQANRRTLGAPSAHRAESL